VCRAILQRIALHEGKRVSRLVYYVYPNHVEAGAVVAHRSAASATE